MNQATNTRRRLLLGTAAVCLARAGTKPGGIPVKSVDDVAQDAELAAFIEGLKGIVARKDARALVTLLHADFRVEFDEGKGPAAFQALWRPADASSEVWGLLERVLAFGGEMHSRTLCSVPYVYARFPLDLDPWQHVAAVKSGAAIRTRPAADAPAIETRSHEILKTWARFHAPVRLDRAEWLAVETGSGDKGFVAAADVCSPVEHRMFFEKRRGRWQWISFVAAD